MSKKELSSKESEVLLEVLKKRFLKHPERHTHIKWDKVEERLKTSPQKLLSLYQMDLTEGEPDIVAYDEKTDEYVFFDCSAESPKGRRSLCYDHEALNARKEHKPANSALHLAEEMGIELLNEEEYRMLQTLGVFDAKTSSWIKTPLEIRKHGGAVFCDRRYDHVFLYHNGADSYYAARGFRGSLRV